MDKQKRIRSMVQGVEISITLILKHSRMLRMQEYLIIIKVHHLAQIDLLDGK